MSSNPLAVVFPHDVFAALVGGVSFLVVLLAGLLIVSRVQLARERRKVRELEERSAW